MRKPRMGPPTSPTTVSTARINIISNIKQAHLIHVLTRTETTNKSFCGPQRKYVDESSRKSTTNNTTSTSKTKFKKRHQDTFLNGVIFLYVLYVSFKIRKGKSAKGFWIAGFEILENLNGNLLSEFETLSCI